MDSPSLLAPELQAQLIAFAQDLVRIPSRSGQEGEVIRFVEARMRALGGTLRGTLVMSRIASVSASLNAVPSECKVYLDRRTIPGETADAIRQEMDQLIAGKKATWEVGTLYRRSWTGLEIKYEPFHAAWKIDLAHPPWHRHASPPTRSALARNLRRSSSGISARMPSPRSAWASPRSALDRVNTSWPICATRAAK